MGPRRVNRRTFLKLAGAAACAVAAGLKVVLPKRDRPLIYRASKYRGEWEWINVPNPPRFTIKDGLWVRHEPDVNCVLINPDWVAV